jgi:uncharacterized protein
LPKKKHLIEKGAGSRSVFVDSSAWIALFSSRDQHHDEADHVFRLLVTSKQPLITSNLVLAEIHRLLLHRAGSRAAATALQKIDESPLVRIEFAGPESHVPAMERLQALRDYDISYADAVSFSIMEALGCHHVLSYDHHFRAAGFEVLCEVSG